MEQMLIILCAVLYGALLISTHKVNDSTKTLGPLIIFLPLFILGTSYEFSFDYDQDFKNLKDGMKYWWVFLSYAPLVLISNTLRTKGIYKNNFVSTSILLNFSIFFSMVIELTYFNKDITLQIFLGMTLLFIAGYILHGKNKITAGLGALYILGHCLFAAINRNIDLYLINNNINFITILFLQELFIIPPTVLIYRKQIYKYLNNFKVDWYAVLAFFIAIIAVPVSFLVNLQSGPTATILAITSGVMITGIIENHRSLHIKSTTMYISCLLSAGAIYLITF